MGYNGLADAVVVFHLLWIVFLALGAIPGSRWAWVKWTHLAALTFAIALQVFHWVCPLTHLEVWLRQRGGGAAYADTFIGHYIERLVYVQLPPATLLIATVVIVVVSLWVYFRPRQNL